MKDILIVQDFVVEGEKVGTVESHAESPLVPGKVQLPNPALHAGVQDDGNEDELEPFEAFTEHLGPLHDDLHVLRENLQKLLGVVFENGHVLLSDGLASQAEVGQLLLVLVRVGLFGVQTQGQGVVVLEGQLLLDV